MQLKRVHARALLSGFKISTQVLFRHECHLVSPEITPCNFAIVTQAIEVANMQESFIGSRHPRTGFERTHVRETTSV